VTPERALVVKLTTANGRVAGVDVSFSGLVGAATVLAGRSPGDVLRLVPALFPVCGVAHGVASARAIAGALGTARDARLEAASEVACLAETAASHVWHLAIGWANAAGAPVDVGSVRLARRALDALRSGLFGAGSLATLRPAGATGDMGDSVSTLVALLDALTAGECSLLARVREAGRGAFGAARTRAVAALDVDAVGSLLAGDPEFSRHAELDGAPVDVSALSRRRESAGVRTIVKEHGEGLLARLAARREDARGVGPRLAESFANLERRVAVSPRAPTAPGTGVGWAETARGPLVYWVRATPARVEDVRVVSPTDWTFHPRGALREALLDAVVVPTLARDAGWLTLALDPCVPWAVEVNDA
jgi:hypothetical protein